MRHIQARHYTKGRIKAVRLIVWHDMEAPEKATTAENVARWFSGPDAPQASAHLCADTDSAVLCVNPTDTAWHAPGANADGIGIELAGYSRQSRAEWRDATSLATIDHATPWVAGQMLRFSIPARWLTDAQLANGTTRGMTTHRQVSRVFKKSDHTDPGPGFPYDYVVTSLTRHRPPSSPATYPDLAIGSHGPAVGHLQELLNSHGASPKLKVDEAFGPLTQHAVEVFQRERGMHVTGEVISSTWQALLG